MTLSPSRTGTAASQRPWAQVAVAVFSEALRRSSSCMCRQAPQALLRRAIIAQKAFSCFLPWKGRSKVSRGRSATGMPVAVL